MLFLTGRLAYDSLCRELAGLAETINQHRRFDYRVLDLGVKVAALMNVELIRRRLDPQALQGIDRVVLPGLCTGPVAELGERFGVAFERGPKDLKDLASYLGSHGRPPDLSAYRVKIFAEIVDAPELDLAAILTRAERYRHDGADVIDLGCLPDTPFPHLADAVRLLREHGFAVSVDSLAGDDLLCAGRAGADYLLSLTESTLRLADELPATPVLIPEQPGDLDSLERACNALARRGRAFYADPVLDPIHFGFTASLVRYAELRRRLPEVPILMGVGNVTELTDADTTGINALLAGVISELDIAALLTTEVSPHCASAVREADLARRVMLAAKTDAQLPRGYSNGLLALRDRKPFPHSREDIAATATAVGDRNYRIQLSRDGIHLYNRDGLWTATEPYALYPHLTLDGDCSHAFYLGVELARAQVAWQLGKRYLQDNELDWGVVRPAAQDDLEQGYRQRQVAAAAGTKPDRRASKG